MYFDALELATGGKERAVNVNVKAVTSLSTAITGWVAESILNEPDTKKRTALVKFFIKVADVRHLGLDLHDIVLTLFPSSGVLRCKTSARHAPSWLRWTLRQYLACIRRGL